MRRLADDLVLSLKDQIRTLRYSLRSEAEGSSSTTADLHRHELGPIGAVGAMIPTHVLRMADGLFTQVENVTLGLLDHPGEDLDFPKPVTEYFGRTDDRTPFTQDLYGETKALLGRYGARHILVSEHAIEDLRNELTARHRDLILSAVGRRKPSGTNDEALVRVCAAIAVGFAHVRPISKADLINAGGKARHLMLAPNLYAGLVLTLAIAMRTVRPDAKDLDGLELTDSADAVVDARFERFKAAVDSKDPVTALAKEYEAVLPFLP